MAEFSAVFKKVEKLYHLLRDFLNFHVPELSVAIFKILISVKLKKSFLFKLGKHRYCRNIYRCRSPLL